MKLKKIYQNLPDTVRYIITAVALWILAVLAGMAPDEYQGFLQVISGLFMAVGLVIVFFLIQRYLSQRFNSVTMLQRMNAHVLFGRLNILEAQLCLFSEKLELLPFPQNTDCVQLLEKALSVLNDESWQDSIQTLSKSSNLHHEERENLKKGFEQLNRLFQAIRELEKVQSPQPAELVTWQKRLHQLTENTLEPFRKVIWHIEA